MREKPYFRFYSVDMLGSCEYLPQELFECYSSTCETYPLDEDDVRFLFLLPVFFGWTAGVFGTTFITNVSLFSCHSHTCIFRDKPYTSPPSSLSTLSTITHYSMSIFVNKDPTRNTSNRSLRTGIPTRRMGTMGHALRRLLRYIPNTPRKLMVRL